MADTTLAQKLLGRLDASGKNIRVFLDFHSTNRNVFYAPDNDHPTTPPLFTRTWLENAKPRVKEYDFVYEENSVDEVGDETNRNAIKQAATVFAEELMLLMLEQKYE